MAYMIPNSGEVLLLGKATVSSLTLALFNNDVTLAKDNEKSDFTLASYAGGTKTVSDPTIATDGEGDSYATYDQETFTFTDSETIYGWILYEGTTVLGVEKFDAAKSFLVTDEFKLTAKIKME